MEGRTTSILDLRMLAEQVLRVTCNLLAFLPKAHGINGMSGVKKGLADQTWSENYHEPPCHPEKKGNCNIV